MVNPRVLFWVLKNSVIEQGQFRTEVLKGNIGSGMESRMLVDVINRALLRLKRYPDRGELYYEILVKQFIHRFNSTEKELLDELNMERSVFYDRKREALFLFSVCLFGYTVPELQEEMEVPRLFPD